MKKIFLFLFFILLIQQAFALDVQIQVQPKFQEGETLSFDYRFISSTNEGVVYTPFIECSKMLIPLLKIEKLDLLANQMMGNTFTGEIVGKDVESQICTAFIQIHKPVNKLISRDFNIDNLLPFDFNIILDKKIFVQGEEIKIDYNSSVENLDVVAKLSLVDNQKQISFPYSFEAEQLGTYELEVIVTKEGYKTVTKKEKFGIIKKSVEVPFAEKISVDKKSLFDRIFGLFRKPEYISCSDTDEGLNPGEAGSVLANYVEAGREKTKAFYDKCYNGKLKKFRGDLREFYCKENNAFAFKYIKCENGCVDGRCL